jgi:hypothetical protein
MKKIWLKSGVLAVITVILCVLLISLTSCSSQPTTPEGEEIINDQWIVVYKNPLVVYSKDTKIMYYYNFGGYTSYLSPYLIYKDGHIYGSIFENGEIVPVPFAVN